MAQINLSTKEKQTHRLGVAKGMGKGVGRTGTVGLVDADAHTENG